MVICLERGADLHMSQLMPLPLTVSCFSKIQIGFTFLVPTHLGSPEKRAVKRGVCVAYSKLKKSSASAIKYNLVAHRPNEIETCIRRDCKFSTSLTFLHFHFSRSITRVRRTFGGKKDERFSRRRLGFSHLVAGEYLDLVVGTGRKSVN